MRTVMMLLFTLATLGATAPGAARGASAQATEPQVVEIQAERFQFTPSEVRAVLGTTLSIQLSSDDTDHGFNIKGTDINVSIPKRGRGTRTVTFTPPAAGRYSFECSHVCGAGHSFMRGVIVVTAPAQEAI